MSTYTYQQAHALADKVYELVIGSDPDRYCDALVDVGYVRGLMDAGMPENTELFALHVQPLVDFIAEFPVEWEEEQVEPWTYVFVGDKGHDAWALVSPEGEQQDDYWYGSYAEVAAACADKNSEA